MFKKNKERKRGTVKYRGKILPYIYSNGESQREILSQTNFCTVHLSLSCQPVWVLPYLSLQPYSHVRQSILNLISHTLDSLVLPVFLSSFFIFLFFSSYIQWREVLGDITVEPFYYYDFFLSQLHTRLVLFNNRCLLRSHTSNFSATPWLLREMKGRKGWNIFF